MISQRKPSRNSCGQPELSTKFDAEFKILVAYESDEFAARAVNNNLAYAENYLKTKGCRFTVHKAGKGDFAKETIRLQLPKNTDLIIIMTNQEKELAHYIVGPYEQNVIANDAQIPVMTFASGSNIERCFRTPV
ncbi:MAG: hypothetical protein R2850_03915 [Bacteroidia bacterium]